MGVGALGNEVLFHRGQLLSQCGHITSLPHLIGCWTAGWLVECDSGARHSVAEFADTMLGSLASPRRTTLLEAKRRPPEKTGMRSTEAERMELPGARLGTDVSG